jgi:hypothetical protein
MRFFVPVTLCLAALCPIFTSAQTVIGTEVTAAKNGAPPLSVHAKCLQHFEQAFVEPQSVRWRITAEGFGANFSSQGITYDVRYNQKGRWQATIRYIPIALLDRHVAATVKRVYPRYNIFFAQQLSVTKGSMYVIKIEKGNEWKLLNVVNHTVIVAGEYVKN